MAACVWFNLWIRMLFVHTRHVIFRLDHHHKQLFSTDDASQTPMLPLSSKSSSSHDHHHHHHHHHRHRPRLDEDSLPRRSDAAAAGDSSAPADTQDVLPVSDDDQALMAVDKATSSTGELTQLIPATAGPCGKRKSKPECNDSFHAFPHKSE